MEANNADQLANHLHDRHNYRSTDAGRIAKHVKYWMEYDEQLGKDI
jgi:hypothetical protein